MTEFVLELYVSRADPDRVRADVVRARQAVDSLRREDVPIRFLRSLYLPEEETCFYLYEAETIEHVQEAASRAALPFERIVEALSEPRSI